MQYLLPWNQQISIDNRYKIRDQWGAAGSMGSIWVFWDSNVCEFEGRDSNLCDFEGRQGGGRVTGE